MRRVEEDMEHDAAISRQVVTTTGYILLARIIELAVNLITVLLVTRYMGRELFGHYAFVTSYSLFIGVLATGGTYSILIREAARDKAHAGENLGYALIVQCSFTLIAVLLAFLLLPIFTSDPLVTRAAYISVFASIIQALANLFASVFNAFEDTLYLAISVFIERGVFLAGVILVILFEWGFTAIFWMQMLSFSVKLLFCVVVVSLKFARPIFRKSVERGRYFFRESLPLLVSTGFRSLDAQLGTFLLQLLQTAAELGLYGAPYRLISRTNIVPDSVMAGLMPTLSTLVENEEGRQRAFALYGKILKYFLVMTVPAAVIVSFLSTPLVVLLFGTDYREGGHVLLIMVWTLSFLFLDYVFKYFLTALGKQHYETISMSISLAVHFGIGLWLIPIMGARGAAVAMLVAHAVAFLVGYGYVSRTLGMFPLWNIVMRLLVAGLPAVGLLLLWADGPTLLRFVLATALYFGALFPMGLIKKEELAAFWDALRRPSPSDLARSAEGE